MSKFEEWFNLLDSIEDLRNKQSDTNDHLHARIVNKRSHIPGKGGKK